jgi:hypothetical protein
LYASPYALNSADLSVDWSNSIFSVHTYSLLLLLSNLMKGELVIDW